MVKSLGDHSAAVLKTVPTDWCSLAPKRESCRPKFLGPKLQKKGGNGDNLEMCLRTLKPFPFLEMDSDPRYASLFA